MNLVLSERELQRIKASVQPKKEDNYRIERRKELKQLSNEKVKNWPNTLEALRIKKESFLKDREVQEEFKRQEIDREVSSISYSTHTIVLSLSNLSIRYCLQEAELRRQNRLESIRKANELLYAQTDKMKMLKSARLYADVIHTRQHQMVDKKKRIGQEQEEELSHHQQVMDRVSRLKAAEDEKIEKERLLIESIKVTRKVQLEQERQRKEAEAEKLRLEGLAIKEKAVKAMEDEYQEQAMRRKLAADNNTSMIKANEDLKLVKKEMERKEMEEATAREADILRIEKRKLALKQMEAERFARQQEMRQKLIDRAVEQLASKTNTEQAILNKQINEQRAKEDRKEADKEARAKADWDATVASRTAQVNRKRDEMRRQMEEDDMLSDKWRRENEDAIRAEEEKQRKARLETIRIKDNQKEEGRERARKRAEEKLLEVEQAKFLASLEGNDDAKFVELCKAEIEKNIREGKPVYTLLRALEYTAPQLMAAKKTQNIHEREKEK